MHIFEYDQKLYIIEKEIFSNRWSSLIFNFALDCINHSKQDRQNTLKHTVCKKKAWMWTLKPYHAKSFQLYADKTKLMRNHYLWQNGTNYIIILTYLIF